MKRRQFTLGAAAAALPGLLALPARAQSPAGAGYTTLKQRAPVDAPAGRIEVVEFFSYICPFCMKFEPDFEKWIKTAPKDAAVRRVHVGWNMDGKMGEPLQRIYYALEALGQVNALQSRVFVALQTEQKRLDQPDALFAWIAQQGVDRAKFEQAYNSFGVANQIRRANIVTDAYAIDGTPSMGVAGRYAVDIGVAGGAGPMLKIVDTLIERARKEP